MAKKKSIQNQQYDKYWKLTVEYSDILGVQFNNTLNVIVKFIDCNKTKLINLEKDSDDFKVLNKKLQQEIYQIYPKADMGSVRKSINQFVKIRFHTSFL